MLRIIYLTLLTFIALTPLNAEIIYSVSGNKIYELESTTGITNLVYTLPTTTYASARNPITGEIYVVYGSPTRLAKYNVSTGQFTIYSDIGTYLGVIRKLAFDHLGNLYALRYTTPNSTLYSIDINDGSFNLIGQLTGVTISTWGDIVFPPNDNSYFLAVRYKTFYKVQMSNLFVSSLGNPSGNNTWIYGLGFSSDGKLFATTYSRRLYEIDPDTITIINTVTTNTGPNVRIYDLASNHKNPLTDTDSDGLTDLEEESLGTNINNPDSDGDNLSDFDEVNTYLTNPLVKDTDGDTLDDDIEINNNFDPLNPADPLIAGLDTDSDGLTDYQELNLGTDICSKDTDKDGIEDLEEETLGNDSVITNPLDADTDDDGISDGEETSLGTDGYISDPLNPDSDEDGILDGVETSSSPVPGGSSTCSAVTYLGTDPGFSADLDPLQGTNPVSNNSDNGALPDGLEDRNSNGLREFSESDPLNASDDCDNKTGCYCNSFIPIKEEIIRLANKLADVRVQRTLNHRKKLAREGLCEGIKASIEKKVLEDADKWRNLLNGYVTEDLPDYEYVNCSGQLLCSKQDVSETLKVIKSLTDKLRKRARNKLRNPCVREKSTKVEQLLRGTRRIRRKIYRALKEYPLEINMCS